MRAVVHARPHAWARRATEALAAGLARHGATTETTDHDRPVPADLVALWGVSWPEVIAECERVDQPYLVMELGWLPPRMEEVSLVWSGLKRHGSFPAPSMTRWARRYAPHVRPWSSGRSRRVLVADQKPGDASVRGVDLRRWVTETMDAIRAIGCEPVYRPHPKIRRQPPLAETLATCGAVVTFNSNTAVDAVLAGVPTVAMDEGSMAWDVSAHAVTDGLTTQPEPYRHAWGARLAGAQWSHDEIMTGEAWEHVRCH